MSRHAWNTKFKVTLKVYSVSSILSTHWIRTLNAITLNLHTSPGRPSSAGLCVKWPEIKTENKDVYLFTKKKTFIHECETVQGANVKWSRYLSWEYSIFIHHTAHALKWHQQQNNGTWRKKKNHASSLFKVFTIRSRKQTAKYIIKLIASRRHLLMCRHVTPNVSTQFPLIIQLRSNEFVE